MINDTKRYIIDMEERILRSGLLTDKLPYGLNNERQKNVTLEWTKPRFLDKKVSVDKDWYDGQLYNTGLYYISRTHGKNQTLLYIGKTSDSFFPRILSHQEDWLYQVRGKIYIRLGYIIKPDYRASLDIPQIIKDVESALIYKMQPPYNEKGRYSYTPTHLYKVTNTRYKGELPETISMRDHILY
jgi:hypothetical protein